jgi:hypothetical protein
MKQKRGRMTAFTFALTRHPSSLIVCVTLVPRSNGVFFVLQRPVVKQDTWNNFRAKFYYCFCDFSCNWRLLKIVCRYALNVKWCVCVNLVISCRVCESFIGEFSSRSSVDCIIHAITFTNCDTKTEATWKMLYRKLLFTVLSKNFVQLSVFCFLFHFSSFRSIFFGVNWSL